ncbi:fimbrial protein [Salmonella enterica subsp. enterica]|nr:fimbrial protein [Salmonella enterica subsp. enterica]
MQGVTVGGLHPSGTTFYADVTFNPDVYKSPDGTEQILIDLGKDMKCRNDLQQNYVDYVRMEPYLDEVPPALRNSGIGVWVNGKKITSRTLVAILRHEDGWVPIPVQIRATLSKKPGSSSFIPAGGRLMTLNVYQDNNLGNYNRFKWNFLSSKDIGVTSSACTVNNDSAMTIDMGTVSPGLVGNTYHTTGTRREFTLPLSCPDTTVSERVRIIVYGSTSTDVSDALQTSVPGLGIQIVDAEKDKLIPPGGYTTVDMVNGKGDIRLLAAAIKKNGSVIKAGDFSANMTVALTQD